MMARHLAGPARAKACGYLVMESTSYWFFCNDFQDNG